MATEGRQEEEDEHGKAWTLQGGDSLKTALACLTFSASTSPKISGQSRLETIHLDPDPGHLLGGLGQGAARRVGTGHHHEA